MHIDRTDQVPMPGEPALAAYPISAFGFVCVPTYRTAARGASFGAGEAHDVSGFGFVGQVVDIFAVFPARHALIVMPPAVLIADTVRIADEESSDFLLDTEVNHFAAGFVPKITDAPLGSTALRVFGLL